MVGDALRFYRSETEKDVDRGSRRKSGWSCYPKEKERELELPVMQILRRGASSAFQYSWFTRYMRARIVFGGRAVLSNADRISNDGARTRVRLCFARVRKPVLKSPNDGRTIAKRLTV